MKKNNLSKKAGLFMLAAAMLLTSIVIVGCGSSSDVQPSSKDNVNAPMNPKKMGKGGPAGQTE